MSLSGDGEKTPSKRARGRRRRAGALLFCLVPTVGVVSVDVWVRGRDLLQVSRVPPYVLGIMLSLALWGPLMRAVSRRRGLVPAIAALVIMMLAPSIGLTQTTSFGQFRAYADAFAMDMGIGLLGAVVDPLGAQVPRALRAIAVSTVIAGVLLALARCLGRTPVRESRLCLGLSLGALAAQVAVLPIVNLPSQSAPPDALFFSAVGKVLWMGRAAVAKTGEGHDWQKAPRAPQLPMAPAIARVERATPRNVLLLLTESVRADVVCSAPTTTCATTPATNALLPQRLPLLQLRSSATFTAVSFAAITSGLPGTATAEAYLRAPLGWDYAHAAGFDTAYLTSQHGGFAGLGEWLKPSAITRRLFAEDLDSLAPHIPGADDRALLRRAPRELSALKEPYFAIVHLAGTHYPYVIDPRVTPFEPHGKESSEAGAAALLNRYRNAVHTQDRAIAGFLERLRETEAGQRTVVLFTSDHGESFFEHGVGLHGGTMNEEELHVPGWIDAPPGVLDDAERAALERARDVPTHGIDLLPTMLDLAGIWRQPALASTRATLPGVSWLGDARSPDRRVFVTNCSVLWGCGVPVWSVLGDHRKWVERSGTPSCFDVFADPHERTPLDRERCADLAGLAETERASLAPKR